MSQIEAKTIYLVTNARPEAKDYLKAMENLLAGNKNPFMLARLYYTKAIVLNFSIPKEEIFGYIDSCIYFAEKVGYYQFIVRGTRLKGQYLDKFNNIPEAEKTLLKAYDACKTLNIPFETFRTLVALAGLYEKQMDYNSSLKYSLLAAEIPDKTSFKSTLGTLYLRIAKGYSKVGDDEKAQQYNKLTVDYCIESHQALLPEVYSYIGNYHQTAGRNQIALNYYMLCDSAMNAHKNFTEAVSAYSNLATIYTLNNSLDTAKMYFEKCINISEEREFRYLGRIYLNYSTFLLKLNQDSLALTFAEKAIETTKLNKDFEALPGAIQGKAEALIKLKAYTPGINSLKETIFLKDSLNQVSQQASLAELLTKYETEKKETEILKLNSDKKIQQLQLEKQKALLTGNILAARQKQQEIDLLNQKQQIQELKLAKQKEALTLKELEAETNSRKLQLTQQEKQLKEAELSQQIFSKNLILWGALIAIAFIVLAFNQYRINTHRKNDKEKYLLQNQLSEMRLEALRSQMNPHFIFNALNSINRYIIRNSKETASEYLIKFSKLMRMILENSKSTSVTLENELQALQLYVELEALRFDNKFDFNIFIDPAINKSGIAIPPLILQPFVENAIWHGLMNKQERGAISIKVNQKQNNKLLVVIEDNGVGRQKATEFNSRTHDGKSFGMQITKDRINAFNKNEDNLKITDLFDSQNNSAGTRVEIELNTLAA
ncbi:MAG: histidine kinase [Bacteroidetes bacterium]|nr:histidine kinase [Bacteroidota bacterium]